LEVFILDSNVIKLIELLIQEKVILSLDDLTDERILEFIEMLKSDKDLLKESN
jgi:hypothetical protein